LFIKSQNFCNYCIFSQFKLFPFKIYIMTITKLISYISTVSMAIVIIWAQSEVPIFQSPIPELPWGIVSLVDLYAGFIFVCLWMFYKEKMQHAIIWSLFMLTLGNLTTAIYVLYSIRSSQGDMKKFFMGKNS